MSARRPGRVPVLKQGLAELTLWELSQGPPVLCGSQDQHLRCPQPAHQPPSAPCKSQNPTVPHGGMCREAQLR